MSGLFHAAHDVRRHSRLHRRGRTADVVNYVIIHTILHSVTGRTAEPLQGMLQRRARLVLNGIHQQTTPSEPQRSAPSLSARTSARPRPQTHVPEESAKAVKPTSLAPQAPHPTRKLCPTPRTENELPSQTLPGDPRTGAQRVIRRCHRQSSAPRHVQHRPAHGRRVLVNSRRDPLETDHVGRLRPTPSCHAAAPGPLMSGSVVTIG